MKACLTSEALSEKEAVAQAIEGEGVIGMDYVREVSTLPRINGTRTTGSARPGRWRVEMPMKSSGKIFRPCATGSWPTITGSRKTSCAAFARTVFGHRRASRHHGR